MAELNLTQITEALNGMFTPSNHFVFWYDDEGAFADNIVELRENLNVPIIEMAASQQFHTKLQLLEIQEAGGSALVYSPVPKPALNEDFLADFERFSRSYSADAVTMLREELQLPADQQGFVSDQQAFFASKERKTRFQKLYGPKKNPTLTLLAVLSKADEVTLSGVLRAVIHESTDADNSILSSFAKYGVLTQFWDFIAKGYGYVPAEPTLLGLMSAIFLNFAFDQGQVELPDYYHTYKITQVNNAISFIQNSRNLFTAQQDIQRTAVEVWQAVDAAQQFQKLDVSVLMHIDAFPQLDRMIVKWLTGRLLDGDVATKVGRNTLDELISQRQNMTYHEQYDQVYEIELAALRLLRFHNAGDSDDLGGLVQRYTTTEYTIDTTYRKFIQGMQKVIPDQEDLVVPLRAKVENTYLNDYLSTSINHWNQVYAPTKVPTRNLQRKFYSNYVSNQQNRTVVIISDAFRFEAAKELQAQLDQQDKFETTMDWTITGLPSVTYFGMPALLPNHQLAYAEEKKVTVDDQDCDSLEKRRAILQQEDPNSDAIGVTEFLAMSTDARTALLTGKNTLYMYHNEIDNTGESPRSENQVFDAVSRTIDQLSRVIEILRNRSIRNVLVTADHGFIYRWAPIDEANKIDISSFPTFKKEQRYAFSEQPIELTGVGSQKIGEILGNSDQRYVNYPTNFNIFKAPGAGQNYVHGGASLQEMLVPVLEVTTKRGRSQAENARIHDVTANSRITSRQLTVRLMQDDPISEMVTPAHYTIYFVDDAHRKISGETAFVADISDPDPKARIKPVRVTLAEQPFINGHTYHLVLHNDETGVEYTSDYQMDIVIQGGFGFDI
ncbi:BREX-1 system phosphatase PglZ type A [Lacticaseibacillus yichunensis]|uniref:BREX-1 system phosphatase PglZ type A n=1 Tax=Lacticaseibacillus yichunensis TaxID=2486015 RepID=UPI000F791CB5|nr:BREX-1 system phosphatase PglZ type A [Lacticaseibacillus yichunensis]